MLFGPPGLPAASAQLAQLAQESSYLRQERAEAVRQWLAEATGSFGFLVSPKLVPRSSREQSRKVVPVAKSAAQIVSAAEFIKVGWASVILTIITAGFERCLTKHLV